MIVELKGHSEFLKIRNSWNLLWKDVGTSFFQSWEWSNAWIEVFGQNQEIALSLYCRRAPENLGEVSAILPTFSSRRQTALIGLAAGSESIYSEYLGGLVQPAEETFFDDVFNRLLSTAPDSVCFGPQQTDSLLGVKSTQFFGRRNYRPMDTTRLIGYRAPIAGGFDGYLSTLSANSRSRFRRLLRDAAAAGAVISEACEPLEKLAWLDELIRLHQEDWRSRGEQGAFAKSTAVEFHRYLVGQYTNCRIFRVECGGVVVGFIYGFMSTFASGRAVFEWYQIGCNTTASLALKSPGYVVHLLLLRFLCEEGTITEYDLLAGSNQLKESLGPVQYPVILANWQRNTLIRQAIDGLRAIKRVVEQR